MPGGGSALPGSAGGGSGSARPARHRVEDLLAELALGDALRPRLRVRASTSMLFGAWAAISSTASSFMMRPRGRSRAAPPSRARPRRARSTPRNRWSARPRRRKRRHASSGLGAVDRRVDQVGHLLGEPVAAAVLAEDLLQPLVDRAQMDHVGQRVLDLPLGQRPVRPIGEARGLVETRRRPAA